MIYFKQFSKFMMKLQDKKFWTLFLKILLLLRLLQKPMSILMSNSKLFKIDLRKVRSQIVKKTQKVQKVLLVRVVMKKNLFQKAKFLMRMKSCFQKIEF